jgi:hypothetical protein
VAVWVRVVLQFPGCRGGEVPDPPRSEDHRGALGRHAQDQLGQRCSCERVQGPAIGDVEGSFDVADPSRLSSPSLALVPRVVCDWSASRSPLRIRAPARGPRPARPFHHGLVVVPSEGNFLPFTFKLSFHFIKLLQSTFRVHIWFVCRPRTLTTRRRPRTRTLLGSSTLSQTWTSGGHPTQRRLSRPAHHRACRLCASETSSTG